jgi:hypothetical protein
MGQRDVEPSSVVGKWRILSSSFRRQSPAIDAKQKHSSVVSLPWMNKLDPAALPKGSERPWVARSAEGLLVLKP